MIKQRKKLSLNKNFKMELPLNLVLPCTIKEKDVYSMFSGLLILIKEMAKGEAKKAQTHTDMSYQHLLGMYTMAVKQMNKYKALYNESLRQAK